MILSKVASNRMTVQVYSILVGDRHHSANAAGPDPLERCRQIGLGGLDCERPGNWCAR